MPGIDFKAFREWWRPRLLFSVTTSERIGTVSLKPIPNSNTLYSLILSTILLLLNLSSVWPASVRFNDPSTTKAPILNSYNNLTTVFTRVDSSLPALMLQSDALENHGRKLTSKSAVNARIYQRSHFGYDSGSSVQVLVSKRSWESYNRFKEDTCREDIDEYIADRILNNTENRYFSWEERMFHIALRSIVLPETRDGSFSALIGTPLLRILDPRLFQTEPDSLCKAQKRDSEQEELQAKAEQDRFEDYLINKVLNPSLLLLGRVTSSSSSSAKAHKPNVTTTTPLSPNVVKTPQNSVS